MGMSYSAKDETIDRLIETNKTLRDEIKHLKTEVKAKNENNLKLAEKVKEQEGKIRTLEAELDKAIDNNIKLTPFEASLCVYHLAANAKLLRKTENSIRAYST